MKTGKASNTIANSKAKKKKPKQKEKTKRKRKGDIIPPTTLPRPIIFNNISNTSQIIFHPKGVFRSSKCKLREIKGRSVSLTSVESVALKGDDKNQIEITGDGIDAAELTRLLRKKIGHAVLESVGAAGGDGDKKKEEDKGKENEAKMQMVWPPYHASLPLYYLDSCVESVALKGDDKNQIEITGDGIDAAELTRLLRKKIGHAVLESVGAAGGDGDKKKEEDKGKENEAKMQMVWPPYHASLPLYYLDSCGYSFI
ncbi:hypothetical protein LWI29_025131 [Acer saccharum]|uniref:Uncharacterized protein n=1 Tax=Acer saccharum TaxID=4024 RepID=A0AA39SGB7_ACESA|nr:hypothetical protein LWI29_025131 [Acer saccharum]